MSQLRGSSESTPPGHAPGGFRVPGVALQMPPGVGKAGAKFGDVLPGAPEIPQESCSPAPWTANAAVEDMDVPRDTRCIPRASQPELGFVPWLGDGDTTRENPPPCALNLEAINKSTPHFGGPSADPAPRQSWVPQSPATDPEFPSTSAFAAASPQQAPSAASHLASRQRGDGEVVEGPGERERCWGDLAQTFLSPQGQHQATSPHCLSLLSPSSPEAIAPSPPLSLLLQPLFIGKRWERVFLGVLRPSCSPSLLSWHSPACITPNQAPSAHPSQCNGRGKGRGGRR